VELGLKAGFDPKDIIFTPNCVSIEEIEQGAKLGVRINIDNISILEQFGHKYGDKIPVCVRINPHIMGGAIRKYQPATSIQNLVFQSINFRIYCVWSKQTKCMSKASICIPVPIFLM
jgi:hypothetical protein